MDLFDIIKKSWAEAEVAISALYGNEVWEAYYKNNNTAKLLFIVPFVSGDLQPARVAYATIVLLWAAKKSKNFSEMKTPGDFHGRIELLPCFHGKTALHDLGLTLVKYRGALDLFHDIEAGKYTDTLVMGQLTVADAKSNLEAIESNLDPATEAFASYEAAMAALDGDIAASSSYGTTSDGTLAAQDNLW